MEKILGSDGSKQCGIDYGIEWEFTCQNQRCNFVFRKPKKTYNVRCPKCQGWKLFWVSKRDIDEIISEEVVVPEESLLL